jgi:hypothetical protein
VQINNLDRLVNWSNEFLGRRDNDRVYPVPFNRNEQAARGSSTTVDINVDEENNRGGQPKLLVQPPPTGECIVTVELFLYRERLQQQNGDMRKRDKVEATCTWLYLVQGQICSPSPLLALPLPLSLSPPINVITGSRPALYFRPPSPPHPPEDYSKILATSPKIEDGLHLGALSMVAEFGQQL